MRFPKAAARPSCLATAGPDRPQRVLITQTASSTAAASFPRHFSKGVYGKACWPS